MRVMVVDDEQPSVDELEFLLKKQEGIDVVGTFTEPQKALNAIVLLMPDVVFLDIDMPFMDGVELAREIHSYCGPLQVVFVTGHSRLLADALQVKPSDYLLKPVNENRLCIILEKIRRSDPVDDG